jgi:transcriptional regulator with XRE-family HTH domain
MTLTEKEITGALARQLREQAGLTQTAFWEPLGVKQSVGCRYEADIPIPQAVRILLVAHYVSGIKIDAGTREGVAELSRLGAIQSKHAHARALTSGVRTDLTRAMKSLKTAHDALDSI